jgi:hypothetical protein
MAHETSSSAKCRPKHLEFSVINSLYLQSSIEQFSRKKIAHLSNNLDKFFSVINIEKTLHINELNEVKIKSRNRHYEIHCYENSNNAYQHVLSKHY